MKTKKESTGEEEKDLYITQDEESILLEQPLLVPEEEKAPDLSALESSDLTNEDKIVIQSYINYMFISLP